MKNLRKEYEIVKERRQRAIENLFKEAIINVIAEQQISSTTQQPPIKPEPEQAQQQQTQNKQAPEQQSQETNDEQQYDTVQKQYTVDDMIAELNSIRSGRSFTDPEIYGRLVTFFKGLEDGDRMTLDKLLTDISELVTSVEDAYQQSIKPEMTGNQTGQAANQQPVDASQQKAPMPGVQNIQPQ